MTDDDTAPEVSLSASAEEILEGEDITFTLTRHGDTTEALDPLFNIRIGPDRTRYVYGGDDRPQNTARRWPPARVRSSGPGPSTRTQIWGLQD